MTRVGRGLKEGRILREKDRMGLFRRMTRHWWEKCFKEKALRKVGRGGRVDGCKEHMG